MGEGAGALAAVVDADAAEEAEGGALFKEAGKVGGGMDGEALDGLADLAGIDLEEAEEGGVFLAEEAGEELALRAGPGEEEGAVFPPGKAGEVPGFGGGHGLAGVAGVGAGEAAGGVLPAEEGGGALAEAVAFFQHTEPEVVVLGVAAVVLVAPGFLVGGAADEDAGLDGGAFDEALGGEVGGPAEGVGPFDVAGHAAAEGVFEDDAGGDEVEAVLFGVGELGGEAAGGAPVVGVHAGDPRGAGFPAAEAGGFKDAAFFRGLEEADAGILAGEAFGDGGGVVAAAVENEEEFANGGLEGAFHGAGEGALRVAGGEDDGESGGHGGG